MNSPGAVFGCITVILGAVIAAWATLRASRKNADPPPSSVQNNQTGQQGGQGVLAKVIDGGVHHIVGADPTEIAHSYAQAMRQVGVLETENQSLRDQIGQNDDQALTAVAAAATDLVEEAKQAADSDPFEKALTELREGRPDAAEALFRDIKEERRALGESALKDAARAARHIGALAFYHDTQKALEAYREAVALDPDDADGWNRLGHLRKRLGDLDGARVAYEKVISLGNRASDKSLIAVATGNLGMLLIEKGDQADGCKMLADALQLFEEIGARDRVKQTADLIAEHGCS